VVAEDFETLLDFVGTNMRGLTCKFDHVSCLLFIQLLNMALTLIRSRK
jgi:hypothetical protein